MTTEVAYPSYLRTEENITKVFDFVDKQIGEHGVYHINRADEQQMGEIAAACGLPDCEHGREFVSQVLSNPDNPNATEFTLGRA